MSIGVYDGRGDVEGFVDFLAQRCGRRVGLLGVAIDAYNNNNNRSNTRQKHLNSSQILDHR